jgi:hypothetical protein
MVGTTTAVGRLTVQQSTDATNGGISIFSVNGDGSIISRLNDGGLTFRNGGEERMRISSDGNVLVGATAGRGGGTTGHLFKMPSGDVYFEIMANSTSSQSDILFSDATSGAYGIVGYDHSNDSMRFYVNSSERVTITSGGNVGIGTTGPDAIFHVARASSGGVGGQVVIDNPASSALGNTAEISFLTDAGASGAGTRNARILAVNENVGNGAANLQFHTWNGSASAERVLITAAGNVGIGTTSPLQTASNRTVTTINGTSSAILNLATGDTLRGYVYVDSSGTTLESIGTLSIGTNTSSALVTYTGGTERLRITPEGYLGTTVTGDTITSGDLLGVLSFVSRDASTFSSGGITNIRSYATSTYNTGNVAGDLRFYVSDGLQNTTGTYLFGTEAMRITSPGYVYINAQSNPLPDNAQPQFALTGGAGTDAVAIKHTANGNNTLNIWQTGTTQHNAIAFYKGDTQANRGNIVVTTSGTSYNSVSDYRLKENITPLENGLDRVMQLKPSKFNWIETGNETEGFIAHELQEYFPDAVTGEKDAVYSSTGNIKPQSVDYGRITPLLVKAIQEQQSQIESLKAEIQTLKQ